jgi:hypothetical protein
MNFPILPVLGEIGFSILLSDVIEMGFRYYGGGTFADTSRYKDAFQQRNTILKTKKD